MKIIIIIFLLATLFYVVYGGQQFFRQKPKDLKIREGGEAVLECEISMLQGEVQWTKDGFALGYNPEIPGLPRYSYIGDRKIGVYNLKITNVTLEDDSEFQCQVGPVANNKAIRANARLTVIAPPSSIEIINHSSKDKIQIKENEELEIECLVKNSKPAAKVVWYRGDIELKSGNSSDTVINVPEGKVTRYNVLSKIKIKPTADDDVAEYTCEARHEALPTNMPLRSTVSLSVLYPPGLPYIEGYTEGETVKRGQTIELICRSRGGNPPAQLIWFKNGEPVRMSYRTAGRLSENVYTFTADSNDNKAKYKCEATNVMSPIPYKAEVTLSVLFAPAHVTISGPTEARAGDKVPLTCTTDNSNPPADIKWMVAGRQVRNTSVITTPSPNGGSISTSNITVTVGQNKRSLVVICHGLNMHLTENIVGTHTINVLYPPGHPIISGYTKGTNIPVGTVQMISCISSGGNPLATLTWYKNDKKITSVSKTNDRSVSAEITVYTNMTDNGAIYKCEASNPATEVPFIETVKLNVYFPPDHVRVRKEPAELKPGQIATLTCESSSSNPPAKLSWWKEGIPVGGAINTTKPGLHGGVISTIELKVNVTPEINGVVYTCQATNAPLQRSVHDAFTLDVLFKPVFKELTNKIYSAVEGESLLIFLETKANPSNIVYSWNKNGVSFSKKNSRLIVDGPVLNITRLTRHDNGEYKCTASNSQGSTSITFNISVQYSAYVVSAPQYVVATPGENVELNCTVDGNPLKEDDISWRNKNFYDLDEKTISKTFINSTSYLVLRSPTRKDSGSFDCVVNNGIGNETYKTIELLVKYKPEMDFSPARLKSASNIGSTGRLICRSSSVPKPTFQWFRNRMNLVPNITSKYFSEFRQVNFTTFESILIINNVEASDYGEYECEARNEEGIAKSIIVLNVTSAPDPPLSMTVLNVTHDSVTISWVPGFDGGLKTSYRIRYKADNKNSEREGFRYLDVLTDNLTYYTVNGLNLDTEYVFTIMAFNDRGNSNYMQDVVKTKTSSTPPPSLHSPPLGSLGENEISMKMVVITAVAGITMLALNILVVGCCLRRRSRNKRLSDIMLPEELLGKADIPRIIIISVSITGVILLLFNVLLVACFILRKKKKKIKKGPSEQGSNKSATIEMYAPSSYNETVTGETLSSVSEKSENYSNGEVNADYTEDGCKVANSTYLIDQFDYPFQYPASYEMQHQLRGNHIVPDPEIVQTRNTLPHPVNKGNYISNSMIPPQTIEGTYYNMQAESRYLPYSQPLEYNHTMPTTGSLKRQRGPVLPDVTVLHNNSSPPKLTGPVLSATLMPQPALSTFGQGYPANLETEGHLV